MCIIVRFSSSVESFNLSLHDFPPLRLRAQENRPATITLDRPCCFFGREEKLLSDRVDEGDDCKGSVHPTPKSVSRSSLVLFHYNVQGLVQNLKVDQFNLFLESSNLNPDIICLSEH
ncbi:hypothetical protein J6590_088609 [Homalodisca vitripennis]|nr:hypothetical protein J6590_088609 [Homalodisca vitripennis]